MKKINFLILLVIVLVGTSCEQKYEKQYSWAYPVAGDWTVKTYVAGTPVSGSWKMKSYNSSFGKDSIWIDDYGTSTMKADSTWEITPGNFWTMKAKCAVNMSTKTFQTIGSKNGIGGSYTTIKIMNGKVINNDSIYYEAQFSDDGYYNDNGDLVLTPFATTYQIAGHRAVSYDEYMNQ